MKQANPEFEKNMKTIPHNRIGIQAGAELCQAQEKLGIAMPALPSKKLWSPFHLKRH